MEMKGINLTNEINEFEAVNAETGLEIAVIGMSARLPGAQNIHEFWNNLKNGVESITYFSDEELKAAGVDSRLLENPAYVRSVGGIIKDKDYFDASFFGYTPKEAELMNPQARLFHECAWEALEDAGYDGESFEGLIGLYAGSNSSAYWEGKSLLSGKSEEIGLFAAGHLTNKDFSCMRVSYALNLRGPSINVFTACSTSLVAIHMASQELLSGQCDMALAGGVTLSPHLIRGYLYEEAMILSADGHCRAFAANAGGTCGGEGVGIVVLKNLGDALVDRDHIYAVIKGSAINNDGTGKVGFTAPGINGQVGVIKSCHRASGVEPESIGYIETHGTGTTLGDPIEFEALVRAFNTDKTGFCGIGSVKSNIGHVDAAAGAAGFIKTVLSLKHQQLPPSLHVETTNPKVDFENSPFYVNTKLSQWNNGRYPLRAGVSSFGIGGTNAHVVLEQAPVIGDSAPGREWQLLLLSAKTAAALEKITGNLASYFKENPTVKLADAAYTLKVGRRAFKHRRILICRDIDEAVDKLSSPGPGKTPGFSLAEEKEKRVVFMFPGLGSQYVNMGRGLYEKEPVFREEMDRCFELLRPIMGYDIKEILYPEDGDEELKKLNQGDSIERSAADMNRAGNPGNPLKTIETFEIAQIVIFIFEYALAKLLIKWGITPGAMIGYSFGEYAAACISGVYSLEDGLKLVVARGQLIESLPAGAMLSVPLPREQVIPLLDASPGLSLAIDNGPSCIAAGSVQGVAEFEKRLKQEKLLFMRLHTSRALHSQMMEPILVEFEEILKQFTFNKPQIPYISNVTADWLSAREAADPGYWSRHLRETVQFGDGITRLLKEAETIFIELGPGRDLSALLSRYADKETKPGVINIVRPMEKEIPDTCYLVNKIGQLWLYGVNPDWFEFYRGEKRNRMAIPSYPFEGQRYWIDHDPLTEGVEGVKKLARLPGSPGKLDIAKWFYIPSWERSLLLPGDYHDLSSPCCWLIFVDGCGIGLQVVARLEQAGHDVFTVTVGAEFKKLSESRYAIRPQERRDYEMLFEQISALDRSPTRLVHLWGISEDEELDIARALELGFYSLLYLAQAMVKKGSASEGVIEISVVTNHMQEVSGEEMLCPGKAAVLSPVLVIPQEHPRLFCRSVDIVLPPVGSLGEKRLIEGLLSELFSKPGERLIAFRGNHRLVQRYKSLHLDEIEEETLPLREEGVYLITGGLGEIGFILSEYLAKGFRAKLILTGRSSLPGREEWEQWLATHDENDKVVAKIRKLKRLESLGAKVLVFSVDVAHQEQMQNVMSAAEKQLGPINGVIHAAGLIKDETFKVIQEIGKQECEQQFQAKVYGLMCLENLLQDRDRDKELDFCWVISSISAVLGGLQFVGYAAANAFMDAFVARYNRLSVGHWLSVDWDGTGPAETVMGFQRTLSPSLRTLNQVVFSNGGHLQERIDKWVKLEGFRGESQVQGGDESISSLYPRPDLLNAFVAPRNRVEEELVVIWQEILGFEQIGIEDDFFELGGDSLRAITTISRIHRGLNVEIPLPEFFKRPTVAQQAGYINRSEKSSYSSIDPVEKKDYYALSSAQLRLYILQEMEPGSVSYNEPGVLCLEGELDKGKLAEALGGLIRRHECLRSSIEVTAGEPVQRVHDTVDFSLGYHDTDRVEEMVRDFIKPFDLSRTPFLRSGIIKLEEAKHVLMIDMHHLVTDGVSYEIFTKELIALYEGEELPILRLQYKDYSEWQKSEPVQKAIKKQEAYWLRQFADEVPVLNLPLDYPRSTVQGFEGDVVEFELSIESMQALNRLALDTGATLYMVLLAIYNVLLSKISGQEDVVVGTPTGGRRHADLEPIIGVFVNTLTMRNYPEGSKAFGEFLTELKERTLEAFENQDYPFEDLVEKALNHRDISRNPLFDTFLALQNMETQPNEIPLVDISPLTIKPYEIETRVSKFDLELTCYEGNGRLVGSLGYCTKLFKKETIQRLAKYFQQVVSAVIEDRKKRLCQIEIITEEEKRQVLYDFNDTAMPFPKGKTIHRLFEEQVKKKPDNMVLMGKAEEWRGRRVEGTMEDGGHLTYKELNEKSNQLARGLIEKGVKPDTIVGIMMKRSVEMIIGILGIMKAGGAYLPIDPVYPPERINYVLTDSSAKILVSDVRNYPGMRHCPVPVLNPIHAFHGRTGNLEMGTGRRERRRTGQFSVPRVPTANISHLAYIIYTSGTTGKPKGVMIETISVIKLVKNSNYIKFTEGERLLITGSIGFDITTFEIWGPLLNGLSLYLADQSMITDAKRLKEVITVNRISILHLIPQLFNQMAAEDIDIFAGLKYFLIGGDIVRPFYINRLREKYQELTILHMYGPTEGTTFSTFLPIERTYEDRIPIGKPVSNSSVYIIGKSNELLPIGAVGEIGIGGEGIARGYLNNPELTLEKFIFLSYRYYRPYWFYISKKVYKTGDLARWLPGGSIEFLGRIDNQVKLRGIRIELGEIERRLSEHPEIREVVVQVLPRAAECRDKYLCAYITASNELSHVEMREYLSGSLPGYMIPSYFVVLDQFPLTSSGKIDRKSLQEIEIEEIRSSVDYSPPRNPIEKKLVEIWRQLLGKDIIGINDNFYMCGGDSIKAIQIASRMNKEGYLVEMRDIFRHTTIAELAQQVKKVERIPDQTAVTAEIPLTPIQRNFFRHYKRVPNHYNQAVMLYWEKGFEQEAISKIFSKIQEHHDALRMNYVQQKGEIIQENRGLDVPLWLEVFDLRNNKDAAKDFENRVNQVQSSIDLEKGPLMKLALFHLDDGDRLLIVIHHLVIDGVSWRILLEDLDTLYRQHKKGESFELPLKTDSFYLWAEKLCQYANSPRFLQERSYWAGVESLSISRIAMDYEAENNVKDMKRLSFSLSEMDTRRLLTEVNHGYGTEVNDVLLTALALGIKKTWGHDKILIALEGHGREDILEGVNVSRTVGWFTTVYPVILQLPDEVDETSLAHVIKKIKECLHQVPHKGIGYGILQYLTAPQHKEGLNFHLNPQMSFNYLGQFDSDLSGISSFKIAKDSTGNSLSPDEKREFLLDVSGLIGDNQLVMSIAYSKRQFKDETILTLLDNYKTGLIEIISHCCAREERQLTPSDLTYKKLSIEALEHLQGQYPLIDVYTLSSMQEGILFHTLYEDSSYIYLEQISYRVHGEVDVEIVKKSLTELFKRHDVLRAAYCYAANIERPLQIILKEREPEFHHHDIRHLGLEEEKFKALAEFERKDRSRAFDLGWDVLVRLSVIRYDEREYEFIWTDHHILMDGWCRGIMISEFLEIYQSCLTHRDYQLPQVIPYRTYIQWLENQDKEKARNYWQKYLEGYNKTSGIPRKSEPGIHDKIEKTHQEIFQLDEKRTCALKQLAASYHVTLNTVIHAVWGILLGKYGGKNDVVFGAVVSGRPSEIIGIETIIGLFTNTVPIRIVYEHKTKFTDLIGKVQEESIAARPYHYFQLAEIQAVSPLKQHLFDHILEFGNYPVVEQIEGMFRGREPVRKDRMFKVSHVEAKNQNNYNFDLIITADQCLVIRFRYNKNVYDSHFVNKISLHLEEIYRQVLENPRIQVGDIKISHDLLAAQSAGERKDQNDFDF